MIKLLLGILLTLLMMAWGIVHYTGEDKTVKVGNKEVHVSSPSDTINSAHGAVDQTQQLQNDINSKASTQLNQ